MVKKINAKLILASICTLFFIGTINASAHHREPSILRILETNTEFSIPSDNNAGGISIATADLGTDGVPEIIIGNGLGSDPYVRVLRNDGSLIGEFLAYAKGMGSGIHVATCDINADGVNEIITSAQRGGGPHIRIFSNMGKAIDNGSFMAYMEDFKGGVNIACGILDDDQNAKIVTLPEVGGGPHVRVWNFSNGKINLQQEFFAFDEKNKNGLVGTISNKKLFLAEQKSSNPFFRTYVIHSSEILIEEKQIDINASGIISLFFKNNELFLSSATNKFIQNVNTGKSESIKSEYDGVVATAFDINNDGIEETITSSSKPFFYETSELKNIIVDTSEQRLYAYENGILQNTFLISSSLKNGVTPIGKHKILAKLPIVHYAWFYGSDSPLNYDLGWVPFNLRFYPHIYIHYAPWHTNFGHRMSRGCVNVSLENMKWIYSWAEVGTEVEVRD